MGVEDTQAAIIEILKKQVQGYRSALAKANTKKATEHERQLTEQQKYLQMLATVEKENDQMKETLLGYEMAEVKHKEDMAALQTKYESNISKSQPHILRDETTFFDRVRIMGLTLTPESHQKYLQYQSNCNTKA